MTDELNAYLKNVSFSRVVVNEHNVDGHFREQLLGSLDGDVITLTVQGSTLVVTITDGEPGSA